MVSPVAVLVAPMVSMTTSWLVRGLPRQLIEMNENSRFSTVFHLLVPGGRWVTVMVRPVRAPRAARGVFHCRVREPLDPPPSAVISSRVASGVGGPADLVPPVADGGHGERGGVVVGAHADPAGVGGGVVDPVRGDLAPLGVDEVVHVDQFGLPPWASIPARCSC